VPAQVAEFSAAGNREDFTTAVNALDGALGVSRPGSTRILVVVSDGRYKGTQHADGQKLITRLAASGCLVIWIAPSDTANTMTGAKVGILADPAATSQAVARAVTLYGREFRKIGRREPTSQVCSACGVRDGPKPLNIREWQCKECGTVHDRDVNAAKNIAALGRRVNARGGQVRPLVTAAPAREAGSRRGAAR
jgi:hypothetical protein